MDEQPPAGWYDDPTDPGRQRFWDGTAWGDQRRDKPPAGDPAPEEKPAEDSNTKVGCLGVIVLAVILVLLVSVCSGGDDSSGGGESMAYVMCQQFVEERLKAPATAGFANRSEATITGTSPTWTVRAHVDSENSFGAKVRTPFTCEITYVGDDEWRLVSLDVEE